jgi:hypothetical protein
MTFEDLKFTNTNIPLGIQALVVFDDYEISVIKNDSSYGNKQGLFEIAVFKGDVQVELPGITEEGDTIKGFLNENEITAILKKMTTITGKEGSNLIDTIPF